jgi:CHAT domain-containing protein
MAGHGLADPQNGMLSCVALSSPLADSVEDGFLQAQEVMSLELDTDLVVLSACQTGLGRLQSGEGLVGLSAAFFVAGTESVCASLWQVPSGPTSQLVAELFRYLKEGTISRAEALRQAQLTVIRQGRDPADQPADYSSPFCWAAFVLSGEHAGGQ